MEGGLNSALGIRILVVLDMEQFASRRRPVFDIAYTELCRDCRRHGEDSGKLFQFALCAGFFAWQSFTRPLGRGDIEEHFRRRPNTVGNCPFASGRARARNFDDIARLDNAGYSGQTAN